MVDITRLRGPQLRAVEALIKLGSDLSNAQLGDSYVLLSKPFHQDRTPSVEVFRDGGYRDWAEDTGWANIGLKALGTYLDLERAAEDRWSAVWAGLAPLSDEAEQYLRDRRISGAGLKSDGPAICFPLWKGDRMVGIQRRWIDGRTPKCRTFPGSDANGLLLPPSGEEGDTYICEGVTDTYTLAAFPVRAIGVLSASTLAGLRDVSFSQATLCFDNDPAGKKAECAVLDMFPDKDFYRLELGRYKDVNDLVCAGADLVRVHVERTGSDLEFIEGTLEQAPVGLWIGWWPPDAPNGVPCAFEPRDGYRWYIFPSYINPVQARRWCWEHRTNGYVVKEAHE